PGARALALDQGVDGDGRAVDQLVDGGDLDAALGDAVDDALHQVRRRAQALGLGEAAGPIVEADQVGERPADVDHDDENAVRPRTRRKAPAMRRSGNRIGRWADEITRDTEGDR